MATKDSYSVSDISNQPVASDNNTGHKKTSHEVGNTVEIVANDNSQRVISGN
jgi:hypothetical protein